MSTPTTHVRPPAVAGSWYPGEARALTRALEECLVRATPRALPGRVIGLVVPHAGLRYSGPVAAHAYAALRGRSGLTVVLIGPSHRAAFDGCAVFARGVWETPLGYVPVDEALAAALVAPREGVVDTAHPHALEHSLEMQVPFLQHLVPDLRIVPVLMGSQARVECERLAARLASAAAERDDVVLLASSDLSHYHPASAAHDLDRLVLGDVERFDSEALMRRLESSWGHACGGGPIVTVMQASQALGATQATVLRYADSGDEGEHDKTRVVGYMAAALTGDSNSHKETP
jgi:hypothetical protein